MEKKGNKKGHIDTIHRTSWEETAHMHLGKRLNSSREEPVLSAGLVGLEKALQYFSEWGCVGGMLKVMA